MGGLPKIVVVDSDASVRQEVADALRPSGFDVLGFAGTPEILERLGVVRPGLIVCDARIAEADTGAFTRAVRAALGEVPFILLFAAGGSRFDFVSGAETGADDYLSKPIHGPSLVARVRARLRLEERRLPAQTLSGTVGQAGTLPLLKLCENGRLTGRLTVEAPGELRWAEFLAGQLVEVGGSPLVKGLDPLDGLLALKSGSYRFEPRPPDAAMLQAVDAKLRARLHPLTHPPAATETPMPNTRVTGVDARGRRYEIRTEASNRPHFLVTTVVTRDGEVLRRFEDGWPHPLNRGPDVELARAQADRQHERVVATIRELTLEPTRVAPAAGTSPDVDGSLLAWALSFVADQAREIVGAVTTVALLRQTHKSLSDRKKALLFFKVLDDGRVVADVAAGAGLPRGAIEAMAAWTVAFLSEGSRSAETVGAIRVRDATLMMAGDLEKVGFYRAFDATTPA